MDALESEEAEGVCRGGGATFVASAEHALRDVLFAIDAHAGPIVVTS